jgi:hypothetical protein
MTDDFFFRWLGNAPCVVWMCPQCGDMEVVRADEHGNEPEVGPQCWQCGTTTQRALIDNARPQGSDDD